MKEGKKGKGKGMEGRKGIEERTKRKNGWTERRMKRRKRR
jgi:hypothetical protein